MPIRSTLLLVCLLLSSAVNAEDIPKWVMSGILFTESSSYYNGKAIVYVNRAVGGDGELGPFQMTRAAFDQVKKPGESFSRLARDPAFAERKAREYLSWLYSGPAQGSWNMAVTMYNAGPNYRGRVTTAYYRRVSAAGRGT